MPETNSLAWADFVRQYPNAHLLQTPAWGALKSAFGWEVIRLVGKNQAGDPVGAQILFRSLPLGLSIAYIPKGPVGMAFQSSTWHQWEPFWNEVDELCRQRNTIFLKVEPDLWEEDEENAFAIQQKSRRVSNGFTRSTQGVQPLRTIVVPIDVDEDQILGRMKQKTRYNIRLALKKGVVVRSSGDIDGFYQLVQETAERDSFGVHTLSYYRMAYELFHPPGDCELLIAEYQGEPLGGLMVFAHGQRAWYFYGASSSRHRERMPNYLLQWEAIRWARARGCTLYDLWGVPDYDQHILEEGVSTRRSGLWGVYRFKRGFGGELKRVSGPWDRVYRPALYTLYRFWVRLRQREA